MAKCVACTSINAIREAKKHPNPTTKALAEILQNRWNRTAHRNTNKFCPYHDKRAGTGRATESVAIAASGDVLRERQARIDAEFEAAQAAKDAQLAKLEEEKNAEALSIA